MIPNTHPHRLSQSSSYKEARLCYNATPEAQKSYVETGSEYVLDFVKWVGEKGGKLAGETVEALVKIGVAFPAGLFRGLKEAWGDHVPEQKDLVDFFYKATEFFRGTPLLGERVFQYFEKNKDYETLKQLVDQGNWMTYFQDNPDFAKGAPVELKYRDPGVENGVGVVANFLNDPTMSETERKQIFVEYMDKYLDPRAVEAATGSSIAASRHLKGEDRFDDLAASKGGKGVALASRSLGAMFGLDRFDRTFKDSSEEVKVRADNGAIENGAQTVARESLRTRYGQEAALKNDYRLALEHQRLGGFRDFSASTLSRDLPVSTMLGALKMGVISDAELDDLSRELTATQQKEREVKANVTANLETLRGDTNADIKKESETFTEKWRELGGGAKLALVAAAVWVFWNRKEGVAKTLWTGGVFVGVAAAVRYFVFNDKNPDKTFSTWTRKSTRALQEKFGNAGTNEAFAASRHASVMTEFLRRHAPKEQANMEKQATALALLHDAPLNLVAGAFQPQPDGRYEFIFTPGSPLDTALASAADYRGVKKGYRQIFTEAAADPAFMNDALDYVFFSIAEKDPANHADAEMVRTAMESLPSKENPHDLLSYGKADAHSAFNRLVSKGHEMASQSGQTVGSVIREQLGVRERPRTPKEKKVTLPPGFVVPAGVILPAGTVLPSGVVLPPTVIPPGVTLPPAIIAPGVILPPGFVAPPGLVLPPGTVLPPGAVIPAAALRPAPTIAPGASVHPSVTVTSGTVLPAGTVLPVGVILPPETIAAGAVAPPAIVDASVVLPPGFIAPPGLVLPAGSVIPPGTIISSSIVH